MTSSSLKIRLAHEDGYNFVMCEQFPKELESKLSRTRKTGNLVAMSLALYMYSPGEAFLDISTSISVTACGDVLHSKCKALPVATSI